MQTEFTCGIYTAKINAYKWRLETNQYCRRFMGSGEIAQMDRITYMGTFAFVFARLFRNVYFKIL